LWNRRNIYFNNADDNVIEDNIMKTDENIIFMQSLALNSCNGNEIMGNEFTIRNDYSYIILKESHHNTFSKNSVTSESTRICWRLILVNADKNTIQGNTFLFGGVRLSGGNWNKIRDNSFTEGVLVLDWSNFNRIIRNHIRGPSDDVGIPMEDSHNNIIRGNTIEDCNGAFYLINSPRNIIIINNMVECGVDPAWFSNSLRTLWVHNYWGRPLLAPKVIVGEVRIVRGWPLPDIVIPVANMDFLPKQLPFPIIA